MKQVTDPALLEQLEGKKPISDQNIVAQLEKADVPTPRQYSLGEVPGEALSNLLPNIGEQIKAVPGAIQGVGDIARTTSPLGWLQLYGEGKDPVKLLTSLGPAIYQDVVDKYGGWENIKRYAAEKPAEFFIDIIGIVTGGGAVAKRTLGAGSTLTKGLQTGATVGQDVMTLGIPRLVEKIPALKPWLQSKLRSPEAPEKLALYEKFGLEPTPAELSTMPKGGAILESVLGYRPLSGDVMYTKAVEKMDRLMEVRQQLIARKAPQNDLELVGKRIKQEAQGILEQFHNVKGEKLNQAGEAVSRYIGTMKPSAVGSRWIELMENARAAKKVEEKGLWDDWKSALPEAGQDKIPLSSDVVNTARRFMQEETSKPIPLQNKELINLLESFGGKPAKLPQGITQRMLEKDPSLKAMIEKSEQPIFTVEGLQNSRSDMLEKIRGILKAQGEHTKESRVYSALEQSLDKEMMGWAEKQGADIAGAAQRARQATYEIHNVFDKDILKLMKSDPEDVLKRIVQKGEVSLINQIRTATGEEGISLLRQGSFKQIMEPAMKGPVLDVKALKKSYDKLGEETQTALFNPAQRQMIEGLTKYGENMAIRQNKMKTVEFLETLSGTSNEAIKRAILKPNSTENLKIAKKLLTENRIDELGSLLVEDILKLSKQGYYLPVSSAGEFVKYQKALREILPQAKYENVRNFIELGKNMQRMETLAKNASQTGQVLMGAQLGGQILKAIPNPLAWPTMAATLGIPWLGAKIYMNPKALGFFKTAIKYDPASREAITNFSRAAALATATISDSPNIDKAQLP